MPMLTFVEGRTLGIALLAAAVLCSSAPAAGSAASPPTGNARGLALLARVHHAYERVPAVTTTAHFRGMSARFTLLLRGGVAVGEEFDGVTSAGTTMLVADGHGPTYAREPGTTCWRRLAPTDQQTLEDVGLRFPDGYRTVVGEPKRSGSTWLLPIHTEGRFPGEGGSFTLHVDGRTLLVESETGRVSGQPLVNRVENLAHRPPLPIPRPNC